MNTPQKTKQPYFSEDDRQGLRKMYEVYDRGWLEGIAEIINEILEQDAREPYLRIPKCDKRQSTDR